MFRDRECFKFRFQNILIHRLPSIGNKFASPHLRLGRVKRRVYGDTMVSWHNQTHLPYNKTIISRCFGQPWIIIHVISLIVAGFLQCGFRASRSVTEIDFPFSLSLIIIMIINRRTSVFYVTSKCHQFFIFFSFPFYVIIFYLFFWKLLFSILLPNETMNEITLDGLSPVTWLYVRGKQWGISRREKHSFAVINRD